LEVLLREQLYLVYFPLVLLVPLVQARALRQRWQTHSQASVLNISRNLPL
jgi:hypothetical protein